MYIGTSNTVTMSGSHTTNDSEGPLKQLISQIGIIISCKLKIILIITIEKENFKVFMIAAGIVTVSISLGLIAITITITCKKRREYLILR